MSELAVRVEGLGKEYRLGGPRERYSTLRDRLNKLASAPFKASRGRRERSEQNPPFWALKDVSFEVPRGKVVGIIGRNGAGKSTLLKILSRITEPTEGEVDINGRVGSLLEVGTGFHPELTGRENVYLNGSILGMRRSEIARKFDEIVAFAEVEKFIDTPVKHYSSGMYMRLAFAVAAHLEPEILIVDEVLAVGDAAFQKKCFGKMGDVATAGRTVLVVSHTAEMLAALCSIGVLLRAGRLAMTGPIESILSTYLGEALNSSDGRFDVSDHKARSRQHRRLIRQIELVDEHCNSTTAFCSGRPFVARLTVRVDRPIADARLALAIEDYMGRRLLTVANYLSPEFRTSSLSGEHIIECKIPALRLGTGRYMVSVSLATRVDGLIDSLNCCGLFDVESHDCYGSGEVFLPVYGPVLETSKWTVN